MHKYLLLTETKMMHFLKAGALMDIRIYVAAFLVSFLTVIIATPLLIRASHKAGLVDRPNERKVHTTAIPRTGGIAIVCGVILGLIMFPVSFPNFKGVAIGSAVIILVGIIDDIYTLPPLYKLAGQIVAAIIPIAYGVTISKFMLPFYGEVNFDVMRYVITFVWIIIVTNSINLIDGLDGLAVGISTIALAIMLLFAFAQQQYMLVGYIVLLIGSNVGFLVYNFHPAKIFMGDVGSLFLGYTISLLSILGFFKGVALTSLLIPVIMLAIPLSDTFFAVVRRVGDKKGIMKPDKSHLHHCLMRIGYSHRRTVLILYGAAILFGTVALFFPYYNYRAAIVLFLILLFFIELFAEIIGLTGRKTNPVLRLLRKIGLLLPDKRT
jgi:UDP-GlcNAc:undecaprenyl-phosphate GlcNAc-1-phosphate transferase